MKSCKEYFLPSFLYIPSDENIQFYIYNMIHFQALRYFDTC